MCLIATGGGRPCAGKLKDLSRKTGGILVYNYGYQAAIMHMYLGIIMKRHFSLQFEQEIANFQFGPNSSFFFMKLLEFSRPDEYLAEYDGTNFSSNKSQWSQQFS